jgi:hypothetical protein
MAVMSFVSGYRFGDTVTAVQSDQSSGAGSYEFISPANVPPQVASKHPFGGSVALPLRKIDPLSSETLGPKIVPMPVYETEMEEVAEEDVAFVLQRATVTENHPIFDEVDQSLQKASRTIEDLRSLANQDPLRFIAMVAAAAFVIGIGLRLWRSSRG